MGPAQRLFGSFSFSLIVRLPAASPSRPLQALTYMPVRAATSPTFSRLRLGCHKNSLRSTDGSTRLTPPTSPTRRRPRASCSGATVPARSLDFARDSRSARMVWSDDGDSRQRSSADWAPGRFWCPNRTYRRQSNGICASRPLSPARRVPLCRAETAAVRMRRPSRIAPRRSPVRVRLAPSPRRPSQQSLAESPSTTCSTMSRTGAVGKTDCRHPFDQ
jgi:hypothetical protein